MGILERFHHYGATLAHGKTIFHQQVDEPCHEEHQERNGGADDAHRTSGTDVLVGNIIHHIKYAQRAGKEHHSKSKHQHPGIEQHVESVRGICPTADDGSERAGINQIFLRHNEVAPFEEGGHGTSDKERAEHAVQHEEELESLGTEEVAQFVLELVAHGLQYKGEQNEHPHPICAAEAGAVEQRERSEEGSAEGNQRGERDFPLAARGIEHHPTAFGSAPERTHQGVGSLNKHQEHEQGA